MKNFLKKYYIYLLLLIIIITLIGYLGNVNAEKLLSEGFLVAILLLGIPILLELKITILYIGWCIFASSFVFDFLDEIIPVADDIQDFSEDITVSMGLFIIIYGFYIVLNERKKIEDKLKYLSFHDSLTKLYNRNFFEEEAKRIEEENYDSVGVVICDIDGLKLVNDTLGHNAGDKLLIEAANIITDCFEERHTISRIGGDEFAILLVDVNRSYIINACNKLRKTIKEYNENKDKLPISISIGFAIKSNALTNILDIFKEADNSMYREKINCISSGRNVIVHALKTMLAERDVVTEEHVNRVQILIRKLATALNLDRNKIKDLELLAQFHDIGKIGIRDNVLNKTTILTPEEYNEIKHHCEIGYRIINSVPELSSIANLILKHHERWDGNGYPLKLKEQEIPLECRILAIVDTYDVITNDRPYKKALSHEEAINEIKRCSGTQFDPVLVQKFIELL